ncbi:MAG: hypothetical protein RL272_1133 [Candidatus Parcubacteria bacterium]|jgi:uncharacterized protein (DUF362 family)
MRSPVSIVPAGADIKDAIRRAVDGIGGLSRFIKAGDRVFIKPNFNTADPFQFRPPAAGPHTKNGRQTGARFTFP